MTKPRKAGRMTRVLSTIVALMLSCAATVKQGKHTFAVVAMDAAGNASSPATQTFTVKKKRKRR